MLSMNRIKLLAPRIGPSNTNIATSRHQQREDGERHLRAIFALSQAPSSSWRPNGKLAFELAFDSFARRDLTLSCGKKRRVMSVTKGFVTAERTTAGQRRCDHSWL